MDSIIQTEKVCYICGSTQNLEKHHIFGASNRNKSEQYGLWVWLDHNHHNENRRGDPGVHHNRELDLKLKQTAQKYFELRYPELDFLQIFGRNYL